MPPILSTYRLQLHAGFRLEDVRALIPYFAALGVTHLHLSPVLAARTGSQHNYDVTDPTRLNPALGAEAEFIALADALRSAGLGIVLDIVPNHMAAHAENPFWEDVLTHGSASRYARWFDIEWRGGEPGPRPRIVLPVLGDLRVRALERGEITLRLRSGRIRVGYFEHEWPLDPLTLHPLFDAIARAAEAGAAAPESARAIRAHGRMLRALSRQRGRTPGEREDVARRADGAADQVAQLLGEGPAAHSAEAALRAFAAPPDGPRRLRRLLDAQAYRIVYWRRAAREINYRRFFDVNELVALHMEDPEVFGQTHARLLEWRDAGAVDGFRVDHPDGLLDPLAYLRRLADEAFDWRPDARYPIYVEKILEPGETLPSAWPVSGTTGYDFLNEVEGLFVDRAGLARLERDYRRLIRRPLTFALVAEEGKRGALGRGLSPGVRLLAARLVRLAADAGTTLSVAAARSALIEVIAALGVYRTYVDRHTPGGSPEDRRRLADAVAAARSRGGAAAALDSLEQALLGGPWPDGEREQLRLRFVQRFQQLTGPAMAKGVEDTAFYAWAPLASLNEVGGAPDALPADAVAAFHASAAARARVWPGAMLATTTHDTKRSADVRSRLDVLSELPDEWEERLYRWRRLTRPLQRRDRDGTAPDANTLYLFFQSLLGIWPVGQPIDDACRGALAARLGEYMLKAAREAKQRTSWLEPDAAYESALADYVAAALDPVRSGPLLSEVGEFARRLAETGAWNALARTVLQLTTPGIPDIYQGDELSNLALVDPDNRRPVDFPRRQAALAEVIRTYGAGQGAARELAALVARPWDGRLKLHVLHRLLTARRQRPALFVGAGYEPLEVRGAAAGSVLAFARRAGDERLIVVVPRLLARRGAAAGTPPVGGRFWEDTAVTLPDDVAGRPLDCLLTGRVLRPADTIRVGELLALVPVAALASATSLRSAPE